MWQLDRIIVAEGTVQAKDRDGNPTDEVKFIVNKAREVTHEEALNYVPGNKRELKKLNDIKPKKTAKDKEQAEKLAKAGSKRRIYVRMADTQDVVKLNLLKTHITENPGEIDIVLVIGPADKKQAIKIPNKSNDSPESLDMLASLYGAENVKVQ